ncbi:MAG: pyridoxal 5'-phosphate synthase glutaminase subunit PdxT [Verrucomicrobiota bacterium]
MIGILALQGGFETHQRKLERMGQKVRLLKLPDELEEIERLIIPGGESTVLKKLMQFWGWEKAIYDFHESGRAVWGTCAGMILLASRTGDPRLDGLGLMDIDIERNGYGTQLDSFEEGGDVVSGGKTSRTSMVFIRAPRIARVGEGVEVLGRLNDEATLVKEGNALASSFHPELCEDTYVEQIFLSV